LINNNFDIVIATYNRPNFLKSLVDQIKDCTLLPRRIIVVDSSDIKNIEIQNTDRVIYIRSSHKNQPYQRYLGYKASEEEFIVFFDDDVKILDKDLFKYLLGSFQEKNTVGSTLRFTSEEVSSVDRSMGTENIKLNNTFITKHLWALTGAPKIKSNGIWLAGLKGDYNYSLGYTEAVGGPGTLAFRRDIVDRLFDDVLFAMYERKLGKGEDKYISVGALKYGKIALVNKICLYHPPHDSSYFDDVYSFARREIYSRLWLSKRIASVKNISPVFMYLHYYWYAAWRIVMAAMHTLISPQKKNLDRFSGRVKGVLDTIVIPMTTEYLCPSIIWEEDLARDIKNIENSDV